MHKANMWQRVLYEPFLDKMILWLLGTYLCYQINSSVYLISNILIALALTCFNSLFYTHKAKFIFYFIYIALSIFDVVFLYFLPLMIYDFFYPKQIWMFIGLGAVLMMNISLPNLFAVLGLMLLSFILRFKHIHSNTLYQDLISLRDQNKEFMMSLEEKNTKLIERQDYEVNLATLNERNRIAREIHDTVGHQLTRSILQVGALQITTDDETTRKQLSSIKQSLDESMNSIRTSIHQLYEDSIDLHLEIEKLIERFTFCLVDFQFQVHSPLPKNIKNAFLAIATEALTNISKHSNATRCTIRFKEHPGFIQLRIIDNGTIASSSTGDGIGLRSIEERVSQLSGYCEFKIKSGFHIFITIPKEVNNEHHTSR